MLRVVWIATLTPLLVVALRLTALDSDSQTLSCADAQTAFETQDFAVALPQMPALLVGNQRVKHWVNTPTQIGKTPILKRTVPGLEPRQLDECFPRLIGHYQPEIVFLFLDTEGLLRTPTDSLLDSLKGIMRQRTLYTLRFDLTLIAPIISPKLSPADRSRIAKLQSDLEVWSTLTLGTSYLAVDDLVAGTDGEVSPHYFWPDGNTLTSEGYEKLTDRLTSLSNERKKEFTGIVSR